MKSPHPHIDTTLMTKPYPRKIRMAIRDLEEFIQWPMFRELCTAAPDTDEWYLALSGLSQLLSLVFEKVNPRDRAPRFWYIGGKHSNYYCLLGEYEKAQKSYYLDMLASSGRGKQGRDYNAPIIPAYLQGTAVPLGVIHKMNMDEIIDFDGSRDAFNKLFTLFTQEQLYYKEFTIYLRDIENHLLRGDIAGWRNAAAPLIDWLDRELDEKGLKEYARWARKNRFIEHDNINFPLTAYKHWLLGRENPMQVEEHAKQSLIAFINTMEAWNYRTDSPSVGDSPDGFLVLSFVMRIDLGVDLDTCRRFADYFLPELLRYPHIHEKLKTLGVNYHPVQLDTPRTPEEIEAVRRFYHKKGADRWLQLDRLQNRSR